jgi:S-adenosylmethionine-dependent methyltransferase
MIEDTRARFDAGAEAWASYNQKPLGRIRREVTWHNLIQHLPVITDLEQPPRVLDAGGGSGELALQLVRHGYRVWLLDYAPAMLDEARKTAAGLPPGLRERLSFCLMRAEDAPRSFPPGSFDVITCHTLLEYVPDPRATLGSLTRLLCEGGTLSVSFVNRHAEVLRQVWTGGDPSGGLSKLERGAFCATLFSISGMAYTAEEVSAWLAGLGLTITASCGVRAFADYVSRERLDDPEFFDALMRLEKTVACRSPYLLLARYIHLFARRQVGSF